MPDRGSGGLRSEAGTQEASDHLEPSGSPPVSRRSGEPLRVATRGSALALAQARIVADGLRAAWPGLEVTLVRVETEGDRRRDLATTQLGGKGVFTAAVQQAVLDGRADLAVHSAKDLPAAQTPGLALAAVPEREDPCDVLVTGGSGGLKSEAATQVGGGHAEPSGSPPVTGGSGGLKAGLPDPLDKLPTGARVGTGSPRRVALLSWLRPDLELLPLRGNVDTRVGKVLSGELDAVVLASAGLRRLGLPAAAGRLDPEVFTPAPGQGCLAVEARADDRRVLDLLAVLTHEPSRTALAGERAFLARLGGSCTLPAGALVTVGAGGGLEARGFLAALDGKGLVREHLSGPPADPATLGRGLADRLLAVCGSEVRAVIEASRKG